MAEAELAPTVRSPLPEPAQQSRRGGRRFKNWWTGASRPKLAKSEAAWLEASILHSKYAAHDVPVATPAGACASKAQAYIHTVSVPPKTLPAGSPGDSPLPLVLMHGYGQGLGVWAKAVDPLVAALPAHGGLHLLDWLGCGLSSRPRFTASTLEKTEAFFIDSLESWRAAMGLEKFVLVGHSFGGFMAASYTMRYPERVAGLVMVSPAGLSDGRPAITDEPQPRYSWKVRRLIGAASTLHWLGATPHGALKFMGARLTRKMVGGYHQATGERRGASDHEIELLTDYHHNVLAGDSGSGEHALNKVLRMGAGGKSPQAERLAESLPLGTPLHFVYGDSDWVQDTTDQVLPAGGSVAQNVLQHRRRKATPAAAPVGKVYSVRHGSHNMMLDNPTDTAKYLADAYGAATAASVARTMRYTTAL